MRWTQYGCLSIVLTGTKNHPLSLHGNTKVDMDLWEDVRRLGATRLCGLKGKEVLFLGLCVAA
uniref:Uncharacterized protein n=1 Tax=Arundo donax TaxID=35708 RepID=A0A0A9CVH7_ARUDO